MISKLLFCGHPADGKRRGKSCLLLLLFATFADKEGYDTLLSFCF